MPIVADLYVPNAANTSWQYRTNRSANLGTQNQSHAERVAYAARPDGRLVYLIEINAYPCTACHQFFINESRGARRSIIVRVTDNQGAYSAEHGIGQRGSVPCIIYYHNGTARYNSMSAAASGINGPPANFPAHPALPEN